MKSPELIKPNKLKDKRDNRSDMYRPINDELIKIEREFYSPRADPFNFQLSCLISLSIS